jgi:geranylgeranyl pyrophosphate synthase/phytoene/squalene synthetase
MIAAQDLSACVEMLPRVSRTFALSIEALPDQLREAVRAAYLLCRIVDTIEDARVLPTGLREQLFSRFDDLLTGRHADPSSLSEYSQTFVHQVGEHDVELMERCGAVFRTFWALPAAQRAAIRGPVLRMSRGMRSYTRRWTSNQKLELVDDDDLESYCYYVAGTVGELLTALFLEFHPLAESGQVADPVGALQGDCVSFGIGLQLVNILKDVAEDAARGVCYLPGDRLAARGMNTQALLAPEFRSRGLRVVEEVIALAHAHLDRAVAYTSQWPSESAAGVRLFLIVPLVLALRTLALIERGGDAVLAPGHTPKVSREFVMETLSRAHAAAGDQDALVELLEYARRTPPKLEIAAVRPSESSTPEEPDTEAFDLEAYLSERAAWVETALSTLAPALPEDAGLSAATRYSLLGGGKRLRPILMLAAAEALGHDPRQLLSAACAVEFIHSYSLVHDDLPAMDDADLRRGRPTSHLAFDEATAILAGDALLTDAFSLLSQPELNSIPASARLEYLHELSGAAGGQGMVLGQMYDMDGEGRALPLAELERLHAHKTGALLRFSVEGAAILLGADKDERDALAAYGRKIGLAFQIADDVLDEVGDAATLGKSARADAGNGKSTFVSLLGVDASRARARDLVSSAKAEIKRFGIRGRALSALADFTVERAL